MYIVCRNGHKSGPHEAGLPLRWPPSFWADPDGRNVNKGQDSQVSMSPHYLLARRLWVRSPFSNATPLLYGAFTMRHFALACDYDGTIAHDGAVDEPTVRALERLRASSRQIILVTGREVSDLCRILPCIRLFDRVVAENGGLIYTPETHEQRELTKPPPERFVSRLRELRVHPLVVGYTIVATLSANEDKVSQAIKELGLQVRITHNKGNIMILPTGVTKGTGLRAALEELALLPRDCIAVGDAENDIAMLKICGLAVAVANALPRVKRHARLVMARARGAGVAELVDWLLATDH
jgi:hydroxymethylpyrimidine pyrophosphatase-like HAD family hydrolase